MAAEALSARGHAVTVCEAKPSVGRKFLMAGKSGLNLTMNAAPEPLMAVYLEAAPHLRKMIAAFDAQAVQDWARGLGQEVFTGSTGRVFPVAMKASPLLRAWLARLEAQGVQIRTRHRWTGWSDGAAGFDTPQGQKIIEADVTVLGLGGGSWARLGADGVWAECLAAEGIALAPFQPANAGVQINWSEHMQRHFGSALKGIALRAGAYRSRGEAVFSARGLEGGGIYAVSRGVRESAPLVIDLLPDQDAETVARRLARPRGKVSLSNHLRKTLKLEPVKVALAQEVARPLPQQPDALAATLKALPVPVAGLRPMDEAISVAGGVAFSGLDENLMLRVRPGTFCAGEMLDWEAPTGGYLLTACFATGRWAGLAAARYLENAA
jgi:uncharacterized flavoprotein (TIGR03862 family)